MKLTIQNGLIVLIFSLCLHTSVSAQTSDTLSTNPATVSGEGFDTAHLWDVANTAYLRSDYREAIRTYEEILNRGLVSAKLYYNLGNACFKDNNLGKAILYYHRALRLKPGDEDIRHNLSIAERHTIDQIEQIPEFFLQAWLRTLRSTLSGRTWSILSLLILAFSLGMLLFYLLSQRLSLRKAGFFGTLVGILLFAITTSFATAARREMVEQRDAVLLSSAVSVKSSPDKAATDLFVIHEGTTLRLGERLGTWQEVTLSDGKKGWLEIRHIETI